MSDMNTDRSEVSSQVLLRLIRALQRKDTDQDGSWGYPSYMSELNELEEMLLQPQDHKEGADNE